MLTGVCVYAFVCVCGGGEGCVFVCAGGRDIRYEEEKEIGSWTLNESQVC